MAHFAGEMNALEAKGHALVPDPGDPTAIFRKRPELTNRGLAEIDRVIEQVDWLLDGAVPAEVTEMFAGMRTTMEETKRVVGIQLAQAVAELN